MKSAGAAASIGVDFIGMVKTNTKGFCKAKIEGLTKYWPDGSCTVSRSRHMVPGERRILAIGYKYNYQKVQSFVSTVGAGSTALGIPCLSKYPGKKSNVSI